MIQTSRVMVLTSLFLALTACGSSPPVHYYSLDRMDVGYQRDGEDSLRIGLGPLRTPDSLSGSRIVTRGKGSEVIIDDFHRWVEPVEDALHRIVAANVDALLDDAIVVAFPYSHMATLNYQVVGRVDRFDADSDGRVVLLAQWTILTPDSEIVVQPKRARYETQASDPGDHGSIARAMSEAIAEFSRDIASEFEAAVP